MTIIQFPHPGRERPEPDWAVASDTHARRFLEAKGRAREDATSKTDVEGKLWFWGEWEADVAQTPITRGGDPAGPERVASPRLIPRASYAGLHNTDPFVFDGPFLYSNCRQGQGGGKLRNLVPGDVVLFGSTLGKEFVLDTLFVVGKRHGEYRAQSATRALANRPPSFVHAVAKPIEASVTISAAAPGCAPPPKGCQPGATFVLYEGATAAAPIDGMFSFAPAIRANSPAHGFARPRLTLHDLNPRCWRRQKQIRGVSTKEVWASVTTQVKEAGLLLGWSFETS